MQVEICPKNYPMENKNVCSPNRVEINMDQSINKIIKNEGFITYEIDKRCVSTSGGNYLGVLYEIDIKGKTKAGDKELNIFVKSVIPGMNDWKVLSIPNIYRTELYFYEVLSNIFNELQDEAHVPLDKRYKMVKNYDESNTEAVIMENISKKGFHTGNRMDVVSLQFAEKAIQELAKFHVFSFVIKEKRPNFFERHIKTIKSPYMFGEDCKEFIQSMVKITMGHVNEDVKEKVELVCEDIADRFAKSFENETIKRCLCHGDYRPNNILTKITNGELSEIIPVDYQMLHFGCPIMDFFYFIFTCTDQEFRRTYLSHLKDFYYESITQFLEYFDIDIKLVYPRKEFNREYRESLDHGLMVSILILPFMFASEKDVPDIFIEEISALSFQVDDKFKERIRGIIEDYIEWGFM